MSYRHLISLLAIGLAFSSCKKQSVIIASDLNGTWKRSDITDSTTYYTNSFTTSCGTVLTYTDTLFTDIPTLTFTNATFDYETNETDVSMWYDSSFSACSLIYLTLSYQNGFSGTHAKVSADNKLTLTYVYHISPGGTKEYTSQTYVIDELDAHNLVLTGSIPLGYFASSQTGTIAFYR